jgi:hypothetical protein
MVGGEEKSIWVLWLLPVFSDLCVMVICRAEGGLQRFMRSNSPEKLLKDFKSFNLQVADPSGRAV